ncbi:MAG: helix-turn-helix domain-containing protein [Devosia sp.]|jgi:antitoxin component HigA of HigAB toxin-antitoxin module|nr:helix-turn-helix domain-containing protein [Devosia sp.]
MNKPLQTFTTPSGDELVVLTRADYEQLVELAAQSDDDEDAELIGIADARMASAEERASLPAEVSRLLLGGMSVLKALRQWRDVGQVKLADDIGSSQGFISDLESGRRAMTPEVRSRLAAALDVPESWLPSG